MKLFNLIKRFERDEDGAVTVDWAWGSSQVLAIARQQPASSSQ